MEDELRGFCFDKVRDALFEAGVKVFSVVGSAAIYMFMDGKTSWKPNDIDILVSPGACDKDACIKFLEEACAEIGWPHAKTHTGTQDSLDIFAPTMRFQIIFRDPLEVIGQFDISVCRVARVYTRSGAAPFFLFEGEAHYDLLHMQFHVGKHFLLPYEEGCSVSAAEHARTKDRVAKYEARGFTAIGVEDKNYTTSRDFTYAAYPLPEEENPSKKRKLDEISIPDELCEQDKLQETD